MVEDVPQPIQRAVDPRSESISEYYDDDETPH